MSDTKQPLALVTGASRGIGLAIADALVAAGYPVVGTATSESGAKAIDERLRDSGGGGRVLRLDDIEQLDAGLKAILLDFGAPLVLVNNAGVTADQLLMRLKLDELDKVLNTNLRGTIWLSKGCLRGMMKARFGRIISIGSVIGSMGNPGQANYAAAKAGLIGFSKSLAQEVGSRGITANMVAPGFIETDMTDSLDEATRERLLSQVAVPRLGTVQDIANAVVFLASEQAGYITGHTLDVNGGMRMN
jgi:3-oxoacyl-[acyl-carrier protein] reductase